MNYKGVCRAAPGFAGFAKYRGSKMDDDFDIPNKEIDKQEMSHLQYPSS